MQGSSRILINNLQPHCLGHRQSHSGGDAHLIDGSSNVVFGEHGSSRNDRESYDEQFVLRYNDTGAPVVGRKYRILRENGEAISGVTDDDGRTVVVTSSGPERITVELLD